MWLVSTELGLGLTSVCPHAGPPHAETLAAATRSLRPALVPSPGGYYGECRCPHQHQEPGKCGKGTRGRLISMQGFITLLSLRGALWAGGHVGGLLCSPTSSLKQRCQAVPWHPGQG